MTQKINDWQHINISIKDLCLWDENARFPDKYFNKTEKELINYFCENKDFKIEELAKEIVKDFDLPQLEKLVVYDTGDQKVVLEGNRRLTVYKLLINPNLAPNDKIRNKFHAFKKDILIDKNYIFECLVTSNKAEGYRYINRKHVNGNNEKAWNEQERTNHNYRRGNATKKEQFKVAIANIIAKLDIPESFKEQVLGRGYVTNFWRILDNSVAWQQFGFSMKDDGKLEIKDSDFKDKLKIIILNVLQKKDFTGKKIDSRTLNKNKEKEEYLGSIKKEDVSKVKAEIEKSSIKNIFGETNIDLNISANKTKINPKSTNRKNLIPNTCRLCINESKINNIYRELRDNLLLDDTNKSVPNAAGVLFRVFLETSIDFYWETKTKQNFADNTKLTTKISNVINYMKNNNIATKKQLENIDRVAVGKNSILSIDYFHSYVHSYKAQPSPSDLKIKWDNLQEFFEILWNNVK